MTELNPTKTQTKNKLFYKSLVMLAVPFALQQFLTSLINLIDNFMLGSVSEDVLTAAGLANKLFFVFLILTYGVVTGASIFMAQFFGKGDLKSVQKHLGLSMIVASGFALIFMAIALFAPRSIMHIFSHDAAVVEHGVNYLRITAFSYLPTALSLCIYGALKSTRHAYIPLLFTLLALGTNASFNAYFIFGLDMSIEGAAYATLIARVVEFFALVITVSIKNTAIKTHLKNYFCLNKQDIKAFAKIAGMVVFIDFQWALGNALYMLAFKGFGTTYQAAVQVTDSCITLLNVFAIALGSAAAVLIGNYIGEGKRQEALMYSKKLWLLSLIFGLFIGGLVAALSGVLPNMFTELSAEGKALTTTCLLLMALAMPVRCCEFMLMVGVLRSGGDTTFCAILDVISVWALTLTAMLCAAYVFHFSFAFVYIFINLEMLAKSVAGSYRLFSTEKWMKNVTVLQT